MASPRRSPRNRPPSGGRLSESIDVNMEPSPAPTPKRSRDDMEMASPWTGGAPSGRPSLSRVGAGDRNTSLSPKAKSKFGGLRVATGDSDEEDEGKPRAIEPLPAGVTPMEGTPGRMTRSAVRRLGADSPSSPFANFARTLSPIVPLSSPALHNFNMFQGAHATSPHKATEPWVHDRAHSVSPVQKPDVKSPGGAGGAYPASAPPATNKPPLPKGVSARRLDFSKPQPGMKTPQGKMHMHRTGLQANRTPVKPLPSAQISTPQSMALAAAAAAAQAPPTPQICNCKKSKCLKLYCECFAAGELCKAGCNCSNCCNNEENEAVRKEAVDATLKRNPSAFIRKMQTMSPDVSSKIEEDKIAQYKQHKGCHCKKSYCLKKYCECFQAGVLCMDHCKCQDCKNFDGSSDLEAILAQNASPAVGSATKRARMTPVQESPQSSALPKKLVM